MEEVQHHQDGIYVQQATQQFWELLVYQPWM
jgi:hypothetical protein